MWLFSFNLNSSTEIVNIRRGMSTLTLTLVFRITNRVTRGKICLLLIAISLAKRLLLRQLLRTVWKKVLLLRPVVKHVLIYFLLKHSVLGIQKLDSAQKYERWSLWAFLQHRPCPPTFSHGLNSILSSISKQRGVHWEHQHIQIMKES